MMNLINLSYRKLQLIHYFNKRGMFNPSYNYRKIADIIIIVIMAIMCINTVNSKHTTITLTLTTITILVGSLG